MRILHVTDLHLTDRSQDEYRWSIFSWIEKRLRIGKYTALAILGDLTEAKDGHSSALIVRLIDNLKMLAKYCPVHIVMGNHDYVDRTMPFFGFLKEIDNVFFYSNVCRIVIGGVSVGVVPHLDAELTKDIRLDIKRSCKNAKLIWLHQTFKGAVSESGRKLNGFRTKTMLRLLPENATLLVGDVHTPQTVGRFIYIGAPHPVDFGDVYNPRAAVWEDGKLTFIKRSTIKKAIVYAKWSEKPSVVLRNLTAGDYVRVVVDTERRLLYRWEWMRERYKFRCKKKGLIMSGIEPRVQVIQTDGKLVMKASLNTPNRILRTYAKATKEFDATMLKKAMLLLVKIKKSAK